jgi:hypothetical protein
MAGKSSLSELKYTSKAVIKQTFALSSIFSIFSYNSKPFIFGILTSISSRSYKLALKFDNASSGSLNVSTIKICFSYSSSPFFTDNVTSGSSSTNRILYCGLIELAIEVLYCCGHMNYTYGWNFANNVV